MNFSLEKLATDSLLLNQNICCGYSLAASRDAANEYPQHNCSHLEIERKKHSLRILWT